MSLEHRACCDRESRWGQAARKALGINHPEYLEEQVKAQVAWAIARAFEWAAEEAERERVCLPLGNIPEWARTMDIRKQACNEIAMALREKAREARASCDVPAKFKGA